MAFKADYMSKFDQLDRFVKQQRSTTTPGAGSATRQKTQQKIALGQSQSENMQIDMENSAQGVRRVLANAQGSQKEKLSPDLEIAASMQAIQELADETESEKPKGESSSVVGKVDFKGNMIDYAVSALADVESSGSGDYSALGQVMKTGMYKGERAYGRYQVMGPNIASWTKKHYGKELTRQEFLQSAEAQNAVVKGELMSSYKKHGNIEDAVSIWFTGKTVKRAGNVSDGDTTAPEYLAKWGRFYNKRRDADQGDDK